MVQTSSFIGFELGDAGALPFRATSLSVWDNPSSHDQTMYNTRIMDVLESYNHRNNVQALRNYNISATHDLFQVILHLSLVCAPEIRFMPSLHSGQGSAF